MIRNDIRRRDYRKEIKDVRGENLKTNEAAATVLKEYY
jgi:hypothetical protein